MREEIRDKERLVHIQSAIKIRPDQLWETIQTDIPELKPIIDRLVEEYKDE